MTTSGSVDINLDTIGAVVNRSTTLGDFVMKGVSDQGGLIGLAIGLAIAIGLLIGLIFLVIGVIPRLLKAIKNIRHA